MVGPRRSVPSRVVLAGGSVLLLVAWLLGCGSEEGGDVSARCPEGQVRFDGACIDDPREDVVSDASDVDEPPGEDAAEDLGGSDAAVDVNAPDAGDWQVAECLPGQSATTLRGRVTIPSGELPLPGVSVYIPSAPPAPIETGARCVRCIDGTGRMPLAETTTDTWGEFTLSPVPHGENIPLVVEVGNWRRQVVIPEVQPCQVLSLSPEVTRLPRHQDEGDIPQFAVTTGGWDAIECLLRKIGIDDREFTPESGGGRVHLFAGRSGTDRYAPHLNSGAPFTQAWVWWERLDNLRQYDIILHSCEGSTHGSDKSVAARQALMEFTELGGRVFLSHYHYYWLSAGPEEFRRVANWASTDSALDSRETGLIDTSFAKGGQLAQWMMETGTVPYGEFPIDQPRGSIRDIDETLATLWVWIEPTCNPLIASAFPFLCSPGGRAIQYFSFNTPVLSSVEDQCGRVVFSDIHVSAGDNSSPERPFPTGCTSQGLTPQEKALVFMLFDLSRCVASDKF